MQDQMASKEFGWVEKFGELPNKDMFVPPGKSAKFWEITCEFLWQSLGRNQVARKLRSNAGKSSFVMFIISWIRIRIWYCFQYLFLVPLIGGWWYIITQLAIYTTYTPLMLMLWQPFSGQIPCFDFTMGTTLFFSPCPWWNVLDPETNPSWTLQFYIQAS